jgi:hypothetical protein
MAIPTKRYERNTVNYLDRDEIAALLAAPNKRTWLGRRDHALLARMIQTGVRVSELTGLRVGDLHLGTGPHIRVLGKGRKKRSTTLTGETVKVLRAWIKERKGQPEEPLFPTRQGRPLSRYTVGVIVAKHTATATDSCPSLQPKRVTPHTLRHTNAMLLRAKGVDIATIALWLGHESTQTTHIYEHADPALKEQAIARTAARRQARQIPAIRHTPRVPRRAVIMLNRSPDEIRLSREKPARRGRPQHNRSRDIQPDVNLSIHPAPIVQPSGRAPDRQWANRPGSRLKTRARNLRALAGERRSRLYFQRAQRMRYSLIRLSSRFNSERYKRP